MPSGLNLRKINPLYWHWVLAIVINNRRKWSGRNRKGRKEVVCTRAGEDKGGGKFSALLAVLHVQAFELSR